MSLKGSSAIRFLYHFHRNTAKGEASTRMNSHALRGVPPINGSKSCTNHPSAIPFQTFKWGLNVADVETPTEDLQSVSATASAQENGRCCGQSAAGAILPTAREVRESLQFQVEIAREAGAFYSATRFLD